MHDPYFDIQYVIGGQEFIGMAGRKELTAYGEFVECNDVVFYEELKISGSVLLIAGDFAVIAPEEAHKLRCVGGQSMLLKIVLKVRV